MSGLRVAQSKAAAPLGASLPLAQTCLGTWAPPAPLWLSNHRIWGEAIMQEEMATKKEEPQQTACPTEHPQVCPTRLGDPRVQAATCHLWTTATRDTLQGASSKRRREAGRLFAFSVLKLSGLILVHTGESVLSELAFVPGKKKNTKQHNQT